MARGGFDGDEIASGAALSERCSLPTKAFCAESESGADEGPREFSVPAEGAPDGGTARPEGMDEIDWFSQIRDWEKLTETGDRNELTFLPDDAELWSRIDARSDLCGGQKCPEFQPCFITAMHQRAQEADLIIVNHHLFFADLAIRQDDFGSILPEYSAVVFDEAHEIEDVASDYFGRQISSYRFEELARHRKHAARLRIEAARPVAAGAHA